MKFTRKTDGRGWPSRLILLLLVVVFLCSALGCNSDKNAAPADDAAAAPAKTVTITLEALNGKQLSLISDAVREYLSAATEAEAAECLYKYQQRYTVASGPSPVTLAWREPSGESLQFTLLLASDPDFQNVTYTLKTRSKRVSLFNLVPGKYYWKVVAPGGEESAVDSFEITDTLRQIHCGNIVNMRDEGGWTGEFGTIKYGLAYRSRDISLADAEAVDVLVNQLGVKTELDLRRGEAAASPDESITYVQAGIIQWDYLFPNIERSSNRSYSPEAVEGLKAAMLVFADSENYPIAFHCAAGADRTGTFAFLLCGLLGISYDDLIKDFEITSFFCGRRWRSEINVNGNAYSFDASGVMEDDSSNLIALGKGYAHIMQEYGTGDGKLSSAIENYLKTVVGITDQNIADIRSNMLQSN